MGIESKVSHELNSFNTNLTSIILSAENRLQSEFEIPSPESIIVFNPHELSFGNTPDEVVDLSEEENLKEALFLLEIEQKIDKIAKDIV